MTLADNDRALEEPLAIDLAPGKKVYFASDFHLGAPNRALSTQREQRVILWLDQVRDDAQAIYLIGDIFDFWFEYKHVIPKGFLRLQGKLAELCDHGISVVFMPGNHDMWMFNYLQEEIGAVVYHRPIDLAIGRHRILVGHGDGLGKGEWGYKFFKRFIMTSAVCRWLFTLLHPDWGVGFAHWWSSKGRKSDIKKVKPFKSKEQEILYVYCQELEKERHRDFYIFGHRHLALDLEIGPNSRYVNIGDWMSLDTYAVYDGHTVALKTFHVADQ